MKNFSPNVLIDYIKFRLDHVGCENEIFSPEAIEAIYELTDGNPRLVNVVCDNALFEGYIRKADIPLDEDIIVSVGEDLGLPNTPPEEDMADRR